VSLAAAPVSSPLPVSPTNTSVVADYQSVIEYTADPARTVTLELDGVALAPLVPFADRFRRSNSNCTIRRWHLSQCCYKVGVSSTVAALPKSPSARPPRGSLVR
jgi:hypothetical protein